MLRIDDQKAGRFGFLFYLTMAGWNRMQKFAINMQTGKGEGG